MHGILSQYGNGSSGGGSGAAAVLIIVYVVLFLLFFAGGWRIFTKAGQPGWAILIPFYNVYIMLKVAGRPGWWLLLFLIPLVNIVVALIVSTDIAKAFGQGAAFGIILIFLLGGLGYVILGFGNYRYLGPVASQALHA